MESSLAHSLQSEEAVAWRPDLHNVCEDVPWTGWFTKYRALRDWLATRDLPSEDVLLVTDENDVAFNANFHQDAFLNAFDRARTRPDGGLGAMVVSMNQSCWVGYYCTAAQVDMLYPEYQGEDPGLCRGYVNGGLWAVEVGQVRWILDALLAPTEAGDLSGMLPGFEGIEDPGIFARDDQAGLMRLRRLHPQELLLDTSQTLFGTTAFWVPAPLGLYYTCGTRRCQQSLRNPWRRDVDGVLARQHEVVDRCGLSRRPMLIHGNGIQKPFFFQWVYCADNVFCSMPLFQYLSAFASLI